jgi:hypothetical protein
MCFKIFIEQKGSHLPLLTSKFLPLNKGHLGQWPIDQKPMDQFEPWIGPFFTLKKPFFPYGTMSVFKSLGSNIQNVLLTCERIRLTFGLFSNFSSFNSWFFYFQFLKKIILITHNGFPFQLFQFFHLQSFITKSSKMICRTSGDTLITFYFV